LELWFRVGKLCKENVITLDHQTKFYLFFPSPSFLPFMCGFDLITIQLVSCIGSTCEFNLHFLDYGRRLLSHQMFDPSLRNLHVVISLEYGYYKHGSHVQCVFLFWNVGIARLGPRLNACFSLKCRYCTWLGPKSSVYFSLECKYCKIGSHVQWVFQFGNVSIARLGPKSNTSLRFVCGYCKVGFHVQSGFK
jgi:hypothetical protein